MASDRLAGAADASTASTGARPHDGPGDATRRYGPVVATDAPTGPRVDTAQEAGRARGELGDAFRPGVYDPEGALDGKRAVVAQTLAEHGYAVHMVTPGDMPVGAAHAYLRRDGNDPGTPLQIRVADDWTSLDNTIERQIRLASKDGRGHGQPNLEVALYGEPGLTSSTVDRELQKTWAVMGWNGEGRVPAVHVVTPDGQLHSRAVERSVTVNRGYSDISPGTPIDPPGGSALARRASGDRHGG